MSLPVVLIVDDDEGMRRALARCFQRNHEVHLAEDGLVGLEKVGALRPDVVITDQQMPGMEGLELLARVRDDLPQTIRILITGDTPPERMNQAVKDGVLHDYLEKPFDPRVLLGAIEKLL